MSSPKLSPFHENAVAILLTGLPGVGKSAIGKELHRLLNPEIDPESLDRHEMNSVLFHHCLLDEPCNTITGRPIPGHEKAPDGYVKLHMSLLQTALDTLQEDPSPRCFIFTARMQVNSALKRSEELEEYIDFTRKRRLPLFWFEITCADKNKHWVRMIEARTTSTVYHNGQHVFVPELLTEGQITKDNVDDGSVKYFSVRYRKIETEMLRKEEVAEKIIKLVLEELEGVDDGGWK